MNYKAFLRPGKRTTDITPLFRDEEAFSCLITDLARLFEDVVIDKVACVEGRGLILGSPVAYVLKAGLVPIRTPGKLPNEVHSQEYVDYSGKRKTLEIHQDAVTPGERVLLIDDWMETGGTIKTAICLIERCGGVVIGIGVFMDDSDQSFKDDLKDYNYRYVQTMSAEDRF